MDIRLILANVKPTIIVCDVEGIEFELFDDVDISGIKGIVMEIHPNKTLHNVGNFLNSFCLQGLNQITSSNCGRVLKLERDRQKQSKAKG